MPSLLQPVPVAQCSSESCLLHVQAVSARTLPSEGRGELQLGVRPVSEP